MKNILITFLAILCISFTMSKPKWDDNKSDWNHLMFAVYNSNHLRLKQLINEGNEINYIAGPPFYLTALNISIRKGDDSSFNLLLNTDSINNINEYMTLASRSSNSGIVKKIIDNGGNVNDTFPSGHSILMYSASFGSIEVFTVLLENGADVSQINRINGWNALFNATLIGDIDKVKMLLKYGANKNYKNQTGIKAYDLVDRISKAENISDSTKRELKELLK